MQILTIAHWSCILVVVNRSEKMEKIQKRCLTIVFDDYDNDYDDYEKWKSNNGNKAIKSSGH